ncbi:MAG: CPBP family intramembrane metalloprotease [Deltaproteobacteria bacterium]|nr:CPBP family intramembrane metalloprotease [Deltaproteobacteria bacterium]
MKGRGYFAATRDPLVSLAVTLPLLLLYNAGLLMPGNTTWNATDLLTRVVLHFFGVAGFLAVNGAIVLGSVILIAVLVRRGQFRPGHWALLCVEGVAWGLLIGFGVTHLMREAGLGPGAGTGLGVVVREVSVVQALSSSAGAGYWEELVFRLGLVGGPIAAAGRLWQGKGAGFKQALVAAGAIVVSSVLFSLAHYVGGLESPDAFTFWYRAISGCVFATIFLVRGFAVAAYSHFLYDVWVMLV